MLYDKIVKTTNVYLGPAAERFITRQVQSHIDKPPEEITKEDLKKLIDWIMVAVSLLTDDSELIEEYISELRKICSDDKTGKGKQRKLL